MGAVEQQLQQLATSFDRYAAQLASGLRSFEGAIALRAARNVPVGAGGRTLAQNGQGRLVGWSLRATGGPVTVAIRDSTQADNGDYLAFVELAAETSETVALGDGVSFVNGLYIVASSTGAGVLQGSVWVGAVS
ncbi:hypothetical protein Q6348_08070 [Isoptericola sp. b441]|uniref:Uncharacterized protein n=1 Tax=Actinotalea lenta TaxID=3064654 RepID=A0ABT9D9J2_9CELL|nr:hypothetical protein [Isoptericola sp. b441]MDO8107151.1 hypothetical protein [Isoptericola sp. b441]